MLLQVGCGFQTPGKLRIQRYMITFLQLCQQLRFQSIQLSRLRIIVKRKLRIEIIIADGFNLTAAAASMSSGGLFDLCTAGIYFVQNGVQILLGLTPAITVNQQIFGTIEHRQACTATDLPVRDAQLVFRDPKPRVAVRALSDQGF